MQENTAPISDTKLCSPARAAILYYILPHEWRSVKEKLMRELSFAGWRGPIEPVCHCAAPSGLRKCVAVLFRGCSQGEVEACASHHPRLNAAATSWLRNVLGTWFFSFLAES